MIVHQGTILDNVKNLLEFAETLQFIDSVSRIVKAGSWFGELENPHLKLLPFSIANIMLLAHINVKVKVWS